MTLSQELKKSFASGDRRRGADYFRRNHVTSLLECDGIVQARVAGADDSYQVTLDLNNIAAGINDVECTCPRFDGGFNCKHIWATILELDSARHGTSSASEPVLSTHRTESKRRSNARKRLPQWRHMFNKLATSNQVFRQRHARLLDGTSRPNEIRIFYIIDASEATRYAGEPERIAIRLMQQVQKRDGQWGKLKKFTIHHGELDELQNPMDRELLRTLIGVAPYARERTGYHDDYAGRFSLFDISPNWGSHVFQALESTGRVFWTLSVDLPLDEFKRVSFDCDEPYSIEIKVRDLAGRNKATMDFCFRRGSQRIGTDALVRMADNGVALLTDRVITVENADAGDILREFQAVGPVEIASRDRDAFITSLASVPALPEVHWPRSWSIRKVSCVPQGQLSLQQHPYSRHQLTAAVSFLYREHEVSAADEQTCFFDKASRQWLQRNSDAERELLDQLTVFPFADNSTYYHRLADLSIHSKHFNAVIQTLAGRGWRIIWMGQRLRRPGVFNISVSSGTDWFDLNAIVDYDGEAISLPQILAALQKKEQFVTLADGSRGQLPDDFIENYAQWAQFGEVRDESIRFRPTQAMLLDAMLQSQENVVFDKKFQKHRRKLQSFSGIQPKDAPQGFHGELREYQREGLSWLHFLREFGLGGCLADDMGLGKTIQVLSLLESRRTRRLAASPKCAGAQPRRRETERTRKSGDDGSTDTSEALKRAAARCRRKPSIVVVPKSLVFNWVDEAAKFTPRLRMLNYTGSARLQTVTDSQGFDVLVTTYGTMRKDIAPLSQVEFDYAILDESTAIKNAAAQSAKASRLLIADHRLAMTGTPIENHIGELWSLFEFLNPGMLGQSTAVTALTSKRVDEESQRVALDALAQGLKPFILRRTKDQVLRDLPEKTEQTLHCDMTPAQRKQYKDLKEYYRAKLAKNIEKQGLKRSKIQVLEALLRLRQVACDPRLLDTSAKRGAKMEMLQQQLEEVLSEGHKILVFSQFTSMLRLLRAELDSNGVIYEYLDGKTSNRAARIKRFQQDPDVQLFLISLKAGGHGLNLTAADYVYLLDPWWNPAVEAQAIDRAHRMGQKRSVMAYRIICRDTVEEKIVALKEKKRELADSIITADESLIRTLSRDDLEVLLS